MLLGSSEGFSGVTPSLEPPARLISSLQATHKEHHFVEVYAIRLPVAL
jgi:hypothetical protein